MNETEKEKLRLTLKELKQKEYAIRGSRKEHALENDAPPDANRSRAMGYSLLGLEFMLIFLGFVWGGQKLDTWLNSTPWLMLLCVLSGFSLALYRLILAARRLGEEPEKSEK